MCGYEEVVRRLASRRTALCPHAFTPNVCEQSKVLTSLDLDEDSDMSVAEQLRIALTQNAVRVIDLFREWDEDGDGNVSKAEFRRAMPMLGLDVPRVAVDNLFDTFDPVRGGRGAEGSGRQEGGGRYAGGECLRGGSQARDPNAADTVAPTLQDGSGSIDYKELSKMLRAPGGGGGSSEESAKRSSSTGKKKVSLATAGAAVQVANKTKRAIAAGSSK